MLRTYVVAALLLPLAAQTAPPAKNSQAFSREIMAWRAQRVKGLTAPDGWLSLEGLFWLKPGANTLGAAQDNNFVLPAPAPQKLGTIHLESDRVHFVPQPGTELQINGKPAREQDLVSDDKNKPDKLTLGPLVMTIIKRGEKYAVRLKNREAKTLREFKGLKYFPVDQRLRIEADWVPYDPPKIIAIPTVLGTAEPMPSPGRAEFEIEGKRVSLEPVLEEPDAKELFFIFKDATAPKETYGAGRFLYTELPKNGKVVLDFNRAYNPPCAFTPYATCPIPPKQNVLPVPIRAGELKYGNH